MSSRLNPLTAAYGALSELYVKTNLHTASFGRLKQLVELAEISGRHKGAVLCGPSGAGKTTLIDRFESWVNERSARDENSPPCVVRILVPADATPAVFSRAILAASGDPLYERGSGRDAELRLIKLLPSMSAVVFVLDEFQHLFEGKSERAIKLAAQMLKNFVSVALRPVVLVGLENIKEFIRSSAELKSRFSQFIELSKFSLDEGEAMDDFIRLIVGVAAVVPTEPANLLKDIPMRMRIWQATEGGVGAVIELAKTACQVAMSEGKESVEVIHFSKAYRMMGHTNAGAQDPFQLPEGELFALVSQTKKKQQKA